MALLPVDVAPSYTGLLNVRPVTRLSPPAAYSGRSMIGRYAAARKRTVEWDAEMRLARGRFALPGLRPGLVK
jgi:hypothetical protein